tara:strand:+ start:28 stop:198 length:171 start_codon:yes stop_codon:yes gene_type:complete
MKVGDLVMLKESCRDSGRYASVLSVSDVLNVAKIIFLDDGMIVSAIPNNVIVISAK